MMGFQLKRLLEQFPRALIIAAAEKKESKIDDRVRQLRIQLERLLQIALRLVEAMKGEERFTAHVPGPRFVGIHIHHDDELIVGPTPVIHLGICTP